jgi:hypothetical protein
MALSGRSDDGRAWWWSWLLLHAATGVVVERVAASWAAEGGMRLESCLVADPLNAPFIRQTAAAHPLIGCSRIAGAGPPDPARSPPSTAPRALQRPTLFTSCRRRSIHVPSLALRDQIDLSASTRSQHAVTATAQRRTLHVAVSQPLSACFPNNSQPRERASENERD